MDNRSPISSTGEIFGKYRILGDLANGGMARLHLAVQVGVQGFEKVVALKRMLPQYADAPEFLEMFLHEAKIAARLDHPNIASIYELGEVSGQYFISMEYLPGEDLNTILRKSRQLGRPMPFPESASLVQSCAQGLHHAHGLQGPGGQSMGLVHRDVSPSNIILTYHGAVKLVDFGIAKANTSLHPTRVGTFKGKLGYAAPEQVTGELVDRRTDVFCLGISLWEVLVGQRLFGGSSEAMIVDKIRQALVEPPSNFRPQIPKSLDYITLKALARDPTERFQTAGEFADAINEYLTSFGGPVASGDLCNWLESLFGNEQGEVKRAIAQGLDLDVHVPRLKKLLSEPSAPEPEPEPAPAPPKLADDFAKTGSAAFGIRPRTAWSSDLAGGIAVPSRGASTIGGPPRPRTSAGGSATTTRDLEPNRSDEPGPKPPAQTGVGSLPPFDPRSLLDPGAPSWLKDSNSPPSSPGARARPASIPGFQPQTGSNQPPVESGSFSSALPVPPPAAATNPPSSGVYPFDPLNNTQWSAEGSQEIPKKTAAFLGTLAVILLVGLGLILMMVSDDPSSGSSQRYADIRIESTPPGSAIFVNGEPTGAVTPARIQSISVGSEVEIRVQKEAYNSEPQRIVAKSEPTKLTFKLTQSAVRVAIPDIPPGARLYVDGNDVDSSGSVLLSLGAHVLRVEAGGDLLVERPVDIRPDTEVIRLFEDQR